eukprot:15456965-Alexandrium_andersonii.AAC.1
MTSEKQPEKGDRSHLSLTQPRARSLMLGNIPMLLIGSNKASNEGNGGGATARAVVAAWMRAGPSSGSEAPPQARAG